MIACRFSWVSRFACPFVISRPFVGCQHIYHCLSFGTQMDSAKGNFYPRKHMERRKNIDLDWRSVSSQASASEAVSNSIDTGEDTIHLDKQMTSSESHSISIEVGSSLMRFIKGKWGSTQKKIEEDTGVKILFPPSRKEDIIVIQGSVDGVTKASKKIQEIIDRVVQSRSLDYSHFVSLPLAIHPELVDKLLIFQKSILESDDSSAIVIDSESGEDKSNDEDSNVAVKLKVEDCVEHVKADTTSIPLVSYAPKGKSSALKSSLLSELGIDKSIFIKPTTFHLTVLMLKLWNRERVALATEVLQSISSKVMDALDNRPIIIRLKGLDCMKGSIDKARVLYVPVEEIGDEGRLLRACQVIINAYIEAGLVLERDANHTLKLHATVMNARHRISNWRTKEIDSFDAREIFKQYGSEDWGDYLVREAHLSQRFVFDDNGYYHMCASIPFPENMHAD